MKQEFNERLRFLDRSGKYEGIFTILSEELSQYGNVSSFCGNLPYSENVTGAVIQNKHRYRNYRTDNLGVCVHFDIKKGALGGVEIYGSNEKTVNELSEKIWKKLRLRDFAVWNVDR